jgi:glycosyltransferase involved in cell wall biosynthesis
MIPITVIIAARNEEANIEKCLKSIFQFVDQIFIIDSESDDQTVSISRKYTNNIFNLPYEHGRIIPWIFQWGLDNLPIRNDWILILESDQVVSQELKKELEVLLSREDIQENGFYILRKQMFRGKFIRFGGYGSKYLLKLFRRNAGELDPVEQDTRVYVRGKVGKLRFPLIENNLKEVDILFYLQKHLRYAQAFSDEEFKRRTQRMKFKQKPTIFGTPDQRVLWLKSFYYHLPLYIRPALYFIYRYFIRLGFLDGKVGFIFHFLQAFWFRFIVDIRIEELLRKEKVS